jgi:hypothetical protein
VCGLCREEVVVKCPCLCRRWRAELLEALRHRTTTSCTDHTISKRRVIQEYKKTFTTMSKRTDECVRGNAVELIQSYWYICCPVPYLPILLIKPKQSLALLRCIPNMKRLITDTHVILSMPHTHALARR